MQDIAKVSNRLNRVLIFAVLVFSAQTACWMPTEKSLDTHECFVTVTAREMLQSGDWVLPTCNGQLRVNKTPLSYWLVAFIAKITGKTDELAGRLPSMFFAFLSAAAILYFVNRWLSLFPFTLTKLPRN